MSELSDYKPTRDVQLTVPNLRRAVDSVLLKWWMFPHLKWPPEMEPLRHEFEELVSRTADMSGKMEEFGLTLSLSPGITEIK